MKRFKFLSKIKKVLFKIKLKFNNYKKMGRAIDKIVSRIVHAYDAPENKYVYWFDYNDLSLKHYYNGEWVPITKAALQTTQLYIDELVAELKKIIDDIIPIYPDKTIEEVTELLGDDILLGKTVAVIENDKVVEYWYQKIYTTELYIYFYMDQIGKYVYATRYPEKDNELYGQPYIAWKTEQNELYYTVLNNSNVFFDNGNEMVVVAVYYEENAVPITAFVPKNVFVYDNKCAYASINGKKVLLISDDGVLTLFGNNGISASITPTLLQQLVEILNS